LAPSERRITGCGAALPVGASSTEPPPVIGPGVIGLGVGGNPEGDGSGLGGIGGTAATPPLPTCEVSPSRTANIACPLNEARCFKRMRASLGDSFGSLCHQRPAA